MASAAAMSPDILITIKIQVGSENRRFKLPLRDLGANTLPEKLRTLLALSPTKTVVFERYSDSAGEYITLDSSNPSVYKQLYRAAKAKLKLRIKATISDNNEIDTTVDQLPPLSPDRLTSHCYVPSMDPDPLKIGYPKSLESVLEDGLSTMSPSSCPTVSTKPPISSPQRIDEMWYQMKRFWDLQINPPACLAAHEKPSSIPSETKSETPIVVSEVVEDEAPVPRPFSERSKAYTGFGTVSMPRATCHLRAIDQDFHVPAASFTVCCDNCQITIPNAHWHCSICQDGDYDICGDCVANGIHCGVEGHFLIKRSIENGKVISSTTETVPKKSNKIEVEKDIPGAFTSDAKEVQVPEIVEMSRTCNSCVNVFEESNFVTCMVCEDYDLCIPCHVGMKHGHHPSHAFAPVSGEANLDTMATLLCAPGRNVRHLAICDGCDKDIYGTRHKCTNCPDWDYCSACIKNARKTHSGHRFLPIHEPLPNSYVRPQVHHGINCDGPLCKKKLARGWIMGDRYKCAVCHDTDFCASCEALPTLRHNRTHPLIKFRTPVRNVSVTTLGEKENGETMCTMGDKLPQTSSKSTETLPTVQSANAATQVQTVAEVKPSEPTEEIIKDVPDPVRPTEEGPGKVDTVQKESEDQKAQAFSTSQLQAHFITDATPDGSKIRMGRPFQQVWVLRNPGPHSWPAGCSVRFVGGDIMFIVRDKHPSNPPEFPGTTESNVITRVVEVGEEIAFWVTMKAPERAGKAISYWRLKSADGTPFGHRLWCDIDVYAPEVKDDEVVRGQTEHIEDTLKTREPKQMILFKDESETESKKEEQSQMIFPKLEKESPMSSTHQDHRSPSSLIADEQELLDDVESLELDDEESSDDGFLTDEEYEILSVDADDGEAINGKK